MIGWWWGRARRAAGQFQSTLFQSQLSNAEKFYLSLIAEVLRRMRLPLDSADIRLRQAGRGASGRPAYAGFIRIHRWDPDHTPWFLQNLPALDHRLRKLVAASDLLESTEFAGVWVQVTSTAQGAPVEFSPLLGVTGGASGLMPFPYQRQASLENSSDSTKSGPTQRY